MKNAMGNLRFLLVFFVFLIMLMATIVIGLLTFLTLHFNFISLRAGTGGFNFIMAILVTSLTVGTMLTAIFGKQLLQPLRDLIDATREASTGNFNIRVEESDAPSELGELVRSFNLMMQEIQGIEMMRNDFIQSVSHEFNTPLASIQGYATLLQDDELSDDDRREYAATIMESAKQLSKLTSNILKLSKLENQEILTDSTVFQLDEQIRQSILVLEPQWSEKALDLDIRLDPVTLKGNEDLLMQVWLNLIGNAIKFTQRKGYIRITLTAADNSAVVEVNDNGCGMNEETQSRIFNKFFQGDNARSAAGNGLGLSLVKSTIDLSGGRIEVESQPEVGSVFRVFLPINGTNGSK